MTWIGGDVGCTLSGSVAGSTLNAAGDTYGLALAPVSHTSAAVKVTFTYEPGIPVETKRIDCPPPGGSNSGPSQDWYRYYVQMHEYERTGNSFTAQAVITGMGTFEGWIYNHSGAGQEGALQEETTIEIKHTPKR